MKMAAASFCLLNGFIPSDQEPVGVAGLPPSKTGCGATPQSTLDSPSCGTNQGPSTMYAAPPATNAGAGSSDFMPFGATPCLKRSPYQVKALTHCSEVKSGVRFLSPLAPADPPSCT